MKTCIYALTVGDVGFLGPLVDSYHRHTRVGAPLIVMFDSCAPTDQEPAKDFLHKAGIPWVDPQLPYEQGLHFLWTECVERARALDLDCVVVLNDDVYLTPGWLFAIEEVLRRNEEIALVGIPCDDQVFKKIPGVLSRWKDGDRTIFYQDDFERYRLTPALKEHHTCGPCWATRPDIWLGAGCDEINRYGWSYGESVMALQLRRIGYDIASIYYPCIYHYGGGSFGDAVNARNMKLSLPDSPLFQQKYGTIHMHELTEKWNAENEGSRNVIYEPPDWLIERLRDCKSEGHP